MKKSYAFIVLLLLFHGGFAQTTTLSETEKAALDSMLKDDEFFNMLKESMKPKSYLQVSAGLGNSYFSIKNKRINASQLESKIVFTPGVSYSHKSGLGIAAAGFLSSFNNKTNFYQFSLTPSYTFTKSKKVAFAVSYTRFFSRKGYQDAVSPIHNDLYATAYLKKPWLEPGISVGFSGGRNTSYKKIDTVLFNIRRVFTDTVKTKLRAFSVNAFIQHSFEYYELLSKKDGISIAPRLIVNAGSNQYTENHYNPFINYLNLNNRRGKTFGRLQENTSFTLQSFAFNLDINYIIGKFGFEPQVYLDYYLPETTDQKFTTIYSFGMSYTF